MAGNGTPVVFVHGLWLHAGSWKGWMERFARAGYEPIAPGWPGIPATVEDARAGADAIPGHGIAAVANHLAEIIASLPEKPIVVGHSFGGLLAQHLLGRDLAAGAVAIDPAPIKGVRSLSLSALRVASIALRNPANGNRAVGLTAEQFRYGFGNALSVAESDELYERWAIPTSGRPLFEAAFANFASNSPAKVDTANSIRGPLLVTAGERDHAVPPVISRATVKRYNGSPALTEYTEFAGRGHSLVIDGGWRDVADTVLAWLKDQSL